MDISSVTGTDGPSPHDNQELARFEVDSDALKSIAEIRNYTQLYAYFYNVLGILPPVPHIGYHEKDCSFPDHWGGIKHAHALFKGIERPYVNGDLHEQIYAYIVKPKFIYKHHSSMVCLAKRVEAPKNSVFAIYVRFNNEIGSILYWEWVFSDEKDELLPQDYETRYSGRVW